MHLSTWYNTLEGWQGRAHDTVSGRLLDMCHNKEVLLHYGTQHTSRHLYCCRQFHSPHWLHPLAAAEGCTFKLVDVIIHWNCIVNSQNYLLWRNLVADYTIITSRTLRITSNHVIYETLHLQLITSTSNLDYAGYHKNLIQYLIIISERNKIKEYKCLCHNREKSLDKKQNKARTKQEENRWL